MHSNSIHCLQHNHVINALSCQTYSLVLAWAPCHIYMYMCVPQYIYTCPVHVQCTRCGPGQYAEPSGVHCELGMYMYMYMQHYSINPNCTCSTCTCIQREAKQEIGFDDYLTCTVDQGKGAFSSLFCKVWFEYSCVVSGSCDGNSSTNKWNHHFWFTCTTWHN